ncbi:hypothetical protein [Bdellovibrio sp. GT3]|uniref:hypothetical protein n=1 Tax=Bdellovibrio sp. GT3 TaxID=3136282 RepID=UPI0030F2C550
MIRLVDLPAIDTLELRIPFEKPFFSYDWERKNKHELILEEVFTLFKLSEANCLGRYRQIYVRGGVNVEINHNSIKILLKGEFFLKVTAWVAIRMLLNSVAKLNLHFYLTRLDICRHYLAGKCSAPLDDLKKDYWILKTGNSFYQPELYVRGISKSLGAYFKSTNLVISCYSKSHQVSELKRKLDQTRMKEEKRARFKKQIAQFNDKFKSIDEEIYRIEWRLLSKAKLSFANDLIQAHQNELQFCGAILRTIQTSHPMRDQSKTLSKKYHRMFKE